MADDPALLPVQLEAFVLNPAVCGDLDTQDTSARIAPITQPNYTFLRIDSFVLQSDVQNHVDLHSTVPSAVNPRMTDLGAIPSKAARRYRYGVYLHWILPRTFRVAAAPSGSEGSATDAATAEPGIEPPTRWVVVRKVEVGSAKNDGKAVPDFPEFEAWVIESDCLWYLDDIPADMDLQVDVSPFVTTDMSNPEEVNIDKQAEVFIGRKTKLESWPPPQQETVASLNLLTSSNQLFADFQLQNTNVFSMLDNFQYGDSTDPQYLDEASASYYLLGWYTKAESDPLFVSGKSGGHADTHTARVATRFMSLKEGGDPETAAQWNNSTSSIRTVCHGATYGVNWNSSQKPAKVPADEFAATLSDNNLPAMAVGTTPIDALISYCRARKAKSPEDSESTDSNISAEDDPIRRLEEDILAIDSLLHARDDGVEGQREAKDTVYNWNFDRSKGGTHYTIGPGDDQSQPLEPDGPSRAMLQVLNQYQLVIDSCNRMLLRKRWDMFSLWWNYVSDVTNSSGNDNNFKQATDIVFKSITSLLDRISQMEKARDEVLSEGLQNAKSGTLEFFYRCRDPTILVGGIKTGWQLDFNEKVGIRLPDQVITASAVPPALKNKVETPLLNTGLLPSTLMPVASLLISEFIALQPDRDDSTQPPQGKSFPQFHHSLSSDTHAEDREGKRDQWQDTQPWFPLYSEWEVEYTHIPFEFWSLGSKATRLSENKQITYGIKESIVLYDDLPQQFLRPGSSPLDNRSAKSDLVEPDIRILSGRSLILPQPTFSLQAKVTQLFEDTAPSILDEYLSEPARQNLLSNINKLSFLSAPLAGLVDGLLTLSSGTHIKPETKFINADNEEEVRVVESARFDEAGFTPTNLGAIDNNSALTPYAAMTKFLSTLNCPFKPVTHGQFRLRKFNIIDKFGQALAAISPVPRRGDPPPYYPSIGQYYEPQLVKGSKTKANTVKEDADGLCEFIQLPPQINQPARLNAHFVMRTNDDFRGAAYWRPATEWENPIWGWIVINYADLGLQFFLPDGIFYREVRWGGPLNALTQPKWIPFSSKDQNDANPQLEALIEKLSLPEYLLSFWKMIVVAQNNLPPAPNTYAQFLNSIVGKPLALVNMGWWLELDSQPLKNQATNVLPQVRKPKIPVTDYPFQVKFGDKEREYDGLVGYFELDKDMKPGAELDLNKIYTYTNPDDEDEGDDSDDENAYPYLEFISEDNYPTFKPVFPSPFEQDDPLNIPLSPRDYEARRNRNLQVYGAIMDPFTTIHAYSSILPARGLTLPPWTWQTPMNVMTAFFHAGPLSLVDDVAEFDPNRVLTTGNWRDTPPVNVALPALGEGEWNWLQPYSVDEGEESKRLYNSYGIEKVGNIAKPGFEKGPYMATEGFLQLRSPITNDKPYPKANADL